jgi:hypothetical protein
MVMDPFSERSYPIAVENGDQVVIAANRPGQYVISDVSYNIRDQL